MSSLDSRYNRLGTGEKLDRAMHRFEVALAKKDWRFELSGVVFDPIAHAAQAAIYTLRDSNDKSVCTAPLVAKGYRIKQGWWSVSQTIIRAAAEYGNHLVFTYIAEEDKIWVTDIRDAEVDRVTGSYSRFDELYHGWSQDKGRLLEAWLEDPSILTVQAKLG